MNITDRRGSVMVFLDNSSGDGHHSLRLPGYRESQSTATIYFNHIGFEQIGL
jgi:hypothetical protein